MKQILVLLMILLALVAPAVALAQTPDQVVTTPSPTPGATASETPSPDLILLEAKNANDRANELFTNFQVLTSIFEGVGGALAFFLAILGFIGFTSFRDFQSRLSEQLEEKVAEVDRHIEEIKKVADELGNARTLGNNAIRALTLVQLGEQQMREGSWRAAKHTLEQAYRLDPDNRAVNYYLGELFIMERDLDNAQTHLIKAQAKEKGETFPPALAALAYVQRLKGDAIYKQTNDMGRRNRFYSEAERNFLDAIEQDDTVRDINGESVYGMLGALYRQRDDIKNALNCYQKAVVITPYRSYPLNNLAMLHFKLGEVEEAQKYFDRSIILAKNNIDNNPTDYWAHFDLINGQLACARQDIARQDLDHVLKTVQLRGPLESFLIGLQVLEESPKPPEHIGEFIARVEEELVRIRDMEEAQAILDQQRTADEQESAAT